MKSPRISAIAKQWREKTEAEEIAEVTPPISLFEEYKPMPGGQTRFWELIPFKEIEPYPCRIAWCKGGIGCFSGDTLINGVPAIELQSAPIEVDTLLGQLTASPVFLKGEANLYRVITRRGKRIVVTEAHRFLTPDGWRQLKSLRCGDYVAIRGNEDDQPQTETPTGSQSHYCGDSRRGGELPHPFEVFAQDSRTQLFSPHSDIRSRCIFSRLTIENCAEGILAPAIASEHLAVLIAAEFAPDLAHKRPQARRMFPPPHSAESLHPLGCPPFEHDSLSRSQSGCRYPDQADSPTNLSTQNTLPFCDHSEFAGNKLILPPRGDLISSPYKALWVNGGNYNDCWDEIVAIEYKNFGDFYDIHVPVANHYLANGFWNHNSGKSNVGAAFACSRAILDPESLGLITANSYPQLEMSTLRALSRFCAKFNIPLTPKRATHEETAKAIAATRLCKINGTPVLVLSAEAFMGTTEKSKETGRGTEIRWFWGDELAYADRSVFLTLNGRLGRGEGKMKGLGVITSSINKNNPFNWCYEFFDDPERPQDRAALYQSINFLTEDNDSLDEEYARSLFATYTDKFAALELRGEYTINTDDLLFNYFDRAIHCQGIELDPTRAIYVSLDFNRNPATGILANVLNDRIVVSEEFYLLDSDTFRLADAAADRVRALNPPRVNLYGDASGKAQTANSRESNWAIVEAALRARNIRFLKWIDPANPAIVDSVNSTNVLFREGRLIIHPRCKELIKDLEYMRDDGHGGIEKKRDPMRTHLGDCLRYLCHKLYPYTARIDTSWITQPDRI